MFTLTFCFFPLFFFFCTLCQSAILHPLQCHLLPCHSASLSSATLSFIPLQFLSFSTLSHSVYDLSLRYLITLPPLSRLHLALLRVYHSSTLSASSSTPSLTLIFHSFLPSCLCHSIPLSPSHLFLCHCHSSTTTPPSTSPSSTLPPCHSSQPFSTPAGRFQGAL